MHLYMGHTKLLDNCLSRSKAIMLPRTFWIILVIIPVLTAIHAKNTSYEDPCVARLFKTGCPSRAECECDEIRGFTIRSREYQGSITRLEATYPCEHRIRRDVMSLTKEERLQYIYAVKTVRTDPRTSRRFYEMAAFHMRHFCKEIHCKVIFLPWHRWYILQYENLLREIVPNITLVYWDWSAVMVNPFDINLWDDNDWSLGGNGNGINHTVITGPFKEPEWKMVPGDGPYGDLQLRRVFSYTYPEPAIPSALHLAILLKLKAEEFLEMLDVLIGYHNNIHSKAFGAKSTMSYAYSVWTPEFFLHHTFIDKYWSEWQEQGYDHKYTAYYMSQTRYMLGTHYLPKDFMDIKYQEGNVCVSYEESTEEWIHKKLRSLTLDQLRDIRGLQLVSFVRDKSIRKIISETDTAFLKRMSEFIQKIILRNPITLKELDGVDRIRGFRLHDLLEISVENDAN